MVRLTDRPDMTTAAYCGCKACLDPPPTYTPNRNREDTLSLAVRLHMYEVQMQSNLGHHCSLRLRTPNTGRLMLLSTYKLRANDKFSQILTAVQIN